MNTIIDTISTLILGAILLLCIDMFLQQLDTAASRPAVHTHPPITRISLPTSKDLKFLNEQAQVSAKSGATPGFIYE